MLSQGLGIDGLMTIVSHFVFIAIAFRAVRALRFEQFLKPNHVRESQVLLVFLAIAIGFTVSSFFLSVLSGARNLIYLIR
ncbi:DUF1146 family protein [Lacticaseibacillus brantae]|uniref:DUF1146 domain-containing protein n=1 Tax=Lacticaseibacillus brantae DSM 23927 TaxID=1423727 RepID=A0A0R2B8V9_9LACO|nr:DUF1146 family protein [Lacticaseibacillus brantae]KRM72939.1 hypothetical protein FC34_GL000651 [Lacticaseibacillus brantae DSM 23927]